MSKSKIPILKVLFVVLHRKLLLLFDFELNTGEPRTEVAVAVLKKGDIEISVAEASHSNTRTQEKATPVTHGSRSMRGLCHEYCTFPITVIF